VKQSDERQKSVIETVCVQATLFARIVNDAAKTACRYNVHAVMRDAPTESAHLSVSLDCSNWTICCQSSSSSTLLLLCL